MKKILFYILCVIVLGILLVSCGQLSNSNNSGQDSIRTDRLDQPNKTLLEQTWDSIYNDYNSDGKKDISNEIVHGEVQFLLMAYVWDHKGKHMPVIEELPYKCLGIAEDKGKFYGLFEFDNDKYNPHVVAQVVGEVPYEKAKELVTGQKYKIKGEVVDFAYPQNKELWADMKKDVYRTGCIKMKNCIFNKI